MSTKTTAFYRGNTEVSVDFSAEGVSSDGAVVLLDKLERTHKVIGHMAGLIPDRRDPGRVTHSVEKLLRQRVFTLMQGYEDCNDVEHLKNDPLFSDILGGKLASQPTLSRFENSVDKHALFALCY
ncbi:MAG: transposase, partial [Balneolaceae bacterium]|nr:transposase [Balneolaceae bacterium]